MTKCLNEGQEVSSLLKEDHLTKNTSTTNNDQQKTPLLSIPIDTRENYPHRIQKQQPIDCRWNNKNACQQIPCALFYFVHIHMQNSRMFLVHPDVSLSSWLPSSVCTSRNKKRPSFSYNDAIVREKCWPISHYRLFLFVF